MGDSFTNFLLVVLIALLGFIGKVFYEKMETVLERIEGILLSDVSQKKDIENMKEDISDHEMRITYLEKHEK